MATSRVFPMLAFLVGLATSMPAYSESQKHTGEQWSIVPTENHIVQSKALGKGVRLQVTLPEGYEPNGEAYPALYYLDAFAFGGSIRELAYYIHLSGEMPRVIMVGIDLEVNTRAEWYEQRSFIFTPSQSDMWEKDYGVLKAWTGGAANFLNSLETEIIPFIDAHYPTHADDRAIVGHSFGGLFALYALFEKPDLFKRHLVSSPSLPWDAKIMFKLEAAYAAKNTDLPAHVFMSVGELENTPDDPMVQDLIDLTAILRARKYKGLHLTSKIFDGETHMSVWGGAFSRGMREIYASPPEEDADQE